MHEPDQRVVCGAVDAPAPTDDLTRFLTGVGMQEHQRRALVMEIIQRQAGDVLLAGNRARTLADPHRGLVLPPRLVQQPDIEMTDAKSAGFTILERRDKGVYEKL